MTIYATATYRDCWAGDVQATLVRKGAGYRWLDHKGRTCDGLRKGTYTLDSMLAIGTWHRGFANVEPIALAEAA